MSIGDMTIGPVDLAKDLWAYAGQGTVELWTAHGCVGVLTVRDVARLPKRLLRLISQTPAKQPRRSARRTGTLGRCPK